jgi:SpoU rRNA methylase family enzyme
MNELTLLITVVILIFTMIINYKSNKLMRKAHQMSKTQEEARIQIEANTVVLLKIQTETGTLLTKIEELLAIINGGNIPVTPELEAAINALEAQVTVVDELVPDTP